MPEQILHGVEHIVGHHFFRLVVWSNGLFSLSFGSLYKRTKTNESSGFLLSLLIVVKIILSESLVIYTLEQIRRLF